ncbi:MAG: rod-binding protein [Janthinobacterium lividum]
MTGPVRATPGGQILPQVAGATLTPAQKQKIAASAQQFEAMAIGQFIAPMFDTVDSSKGLFGGGEAEAAWKPMMVSELAKQIARQGGFGLAQPVMQQMMRLQEAAAT